MTDELKQWEYDKGYTKGYSDGRASLIEELEQLKADFEEIQLLRDNPYNNRTEYSISMKELRELFDEHISELKGENNPDCRSCDKWKTCENGEKGHANGTSIGYSIGECRDYAELKGENKKECSTCKSDNSLENCLGCIEYGHWELKGENK